MSFLDTDNKHPFTLVLSPKFQDINFLNSFEIDNIEKYLEIKEEDIKELEHLCEIAEEADGKTYLRLPLDDSIQFKEITQKLQDSVHFLSRIMSPKKRQKKLGRSYMDDRTRKDEILTPMNLDEAVDVEKEDSPYMGEETQMFADFERILKEFEISAVKSENENKLMLIVEDYKKPENKSILSVLKDESKLLQLSPVKIRNVSFSPSKKRKCDELITVEENYDIESVKERFNVQSEKTLPVLNVETVENVENNIPVLTSSSSTETKAKDKKEKKRTKIYIKGNSTKGCEIF